MVESLLKNVSAWWCQVFQDRATLFHSGKIVHLCDTITDRVNAVWEFCCIMYQNGLHSFTGYKLFCKASLESVYTTPKIIGVDHYNILAYWCKSWKSIIHSVTNFTELSKLCLTLVWVWGVCNFMTPIDFIIITQKR